VLRHTWGYREFGIKKHITVDEFIRGRKRRDGSRMDRGTGLAEQSVRNGLAAAKLHGYLEEFVDDSDKARIKKYYGLKMRPDGTPGADRAPEPGGAPDEPPAPPQTVGPEVQDLDLEVQELDPSGPEFGPRTETNTKHKPFERHASSTIALAEAGVEPSAPAATRPDGAPQDHGPHATASLRIQATIAELSRTFADDGHRGSNTAQAMHLYLTGDCDIDRFEQRVHEAAALTRDAVHRARRSTDGRPIAKPMAYFFQVLRDLLGATGDTQAEPPAPARQGRAA